MKWEGREESQNVEDRSSLGAKAGVALGGGGILIVLLALLFGIDPQRLQGLGLPGGQAEQKGEEGPPDPAEERLKKFTRTIFRDTEIVWEEQFNRMGRTYQKPVLVLFTGRVDSGCGSADSAVGPFYCPADSRVYIDTGFYRDMETQLKAPGEFARAYVVAHEVGHHVQRLLGYSARVDEARRSLPKREYNKMSVRLELQADYLAGVWAHHGQKRFNFLEEGDVESALNAANKIGDDYLQRQSRGTVNRDLFTHGTSAQRMRWFKEGLRTGDVSKARVLFDVNYEEL